MNRRKWSICSIVCAVAAGALSLTPQIAQAGKSDDTLRVVLGTIDNTDLYFSTRRTTMEFALMVYDTLIYRDPSDFSYKPLLATAWRRIDDLTLEFDLRKDVKFHNGDPFTAEDVAYTLNWATNPESKVRVPRNSTWIDKAVVVDPYKVRVISKGPFPAALDYLAMSLPIYPAKYHQAVGLTEFQANPVGTGPYKPVKLEIGKAHRLESNDDYFEGSPKGSKRIRFIDIREVPDAQTQVAELLAGRANIIWNISADDTREIGKLPNFVGNQVEAMRVLFFSMDAAGRSGHEAMQNVDVRRAIAHAVDRQAIVDNLIRGSSRVIDAPCYDRQFGCVVARAVPYEQSLDKAKALMKKAGYESGFDVELYTVPILQPVAEAIAADVAKIGIRVTLRTMEYPGLHKLQIEGKTASYQLSWGSYSVNDVSALIGLFFGANKEDYSGDTELQDWLGRAETIVDRDKRLELYGNAVERITDQVYWLPISTWVRNYAYTSDLTFEPGPDELVRLYSLSWK